MKKEFDLTGQKFGRLIVVREAGSDKRGNRFWWCHCDCGADTKVKAYNLKNGHTKSCGCLAKEATIDNIRAILKSHPEIVDDVREMLEEEFDA